MHTTSMFKQYKLDEWHACLFHTNIWKIKFAWLLLPNCGPWSLWWIYYNITSYEIKNIFFWAIDFVVFWPTIICKNIAKILLNTNMIKVHTWVFKKIVICDNNLGPPHNVISSRDGLFDASYPHLSPPL
jgi:hypothetical protein